MHPPLTKNECVKFTKLLVVYIMGNLGVDKQIIIFCLKYATSGYTFLIR